MKKALIIGAGGFVGSYLAECLQNEFGMEVHATKLPGTQTQEDLLFLGDRVYELDILNKNDIVELLFAGLYISSCGAEFSEYRMERTGAYNRCQYKRQRQSYGCGQRALL